MDELRAVGDGLVKGVLDGVGAESTWNIIDTIAGGTAGSRMELLAVAGSGDGHSVTTVGRSTSGIETFNIKFVDGDTAGNGSLTVDASTLEGAKNFNIVSATASIDDAVIFSNLVKEQVVTIKSTDTDLDVTLGYSSAAKAGTDDVAAFTLNGAKVDNVVIGDGMETVKITAVGANEVATVDAATEATAVSKFIIDGAGSLKATLDGDPKLITDVNASGATGVLDLTVNNGDFAAKASIKGGTSTTDVLHLNGVITSGVAISGFETIMTNDTTTLNMNNVTGATTVGHTGGNLAITNAAGVTDLLIQGGGTAGTTSIGIGSTAFGIKGTTAQDNLAIAINNAGKELGTTGDVEAVISAGAVTASNVKNITINASDADVVLASLDAIKMETLVVTATEDFTLSTTAHLADSQAVAIDMSGVVGTATLVAGALTKGLTYTGSDTKDNLTFDTMAAGETYGIDTGAGNDVVLLGDVISGSGTLTLNLGEGDDSLTIGAASVGAANTFDFGLGTDTLYFTDATTTDLSGFTVSGLEKITLQGGTKALTVASSVINDLSEITVEGVASAQLNVTMGGNENINASGVTFGKGSGLKVTHDVANANDVLTLHADQGKDVVVIADANSVGAAHSDFMINGFEAGANNSAIDVLQIKSGALGLATSGAATALAAGAGAIASGDSGELIVMTSGTANSAADMVSWFNANYSGASGEGVVVAESGTTGKAYIWYVKDTDANGIQATDIHLVGTLDHSGVLDASDFAAIA